MHTRLLFLALLCTVVLLAPLWRGAVAQLLAPRGDPPDSLPQARSAPEKSQAFVLTGMHLLQTQGSRKEFLFTARRVLSENQEELLELEDVATVFFDGDGGVTCTMTGAKGRYLPREQLITVSGDVVVIGREDFKVRTESIRYAAQENIFETESAATIQGRGVTAQGAGLHYDTGAGTLRMGGTEGRVTTTFSSAPR